MKRNEWTFAYRGDAVGGAAKAKRIYHEGRVAYWKAEHESAKETLRSTGIEIREYDHGHLSNRTAGGIQVVSDPALLDRVESTARKVQDHLKRVDDYRSYEVAGLANPTAELELHVDDITFFGLAES